MLDVSFRRQISAEAHGNRAGRYFRESRGDHDVCGNERSRKSGRERKRNGQTVGHPDHDVADYFIAVEMFFHVRGLRHVFICY